MKKILITLLMILSLGTAAQAGRANQNPQLRNLVTSYKGTEGFEIVDLGGVALSLMKARRTTPGKHSSAKRTGFLARAKC